MRFNNRIRKLAGWSSQRAGADFEATIRARFSKAGLSIVRIPDGCKKRRGRNGRPLLIAQKSPFDFIAGYGKQICFFDAKNWDSDRLTYSQIVPHQLDDLCVLGRHQLAGYICNLRKIDKVVFFSHEILSKLRPRNSLSHLDGLDLGSFESFNPRRLFELSNE